ncbi:MAG: hypothetical protein WEE66_05515 [Actinomycetota bacterium]
MDKRVENLTNDQSIKWRTSGLVGAALAAVLLIGAIGYGGPSDAAAKDKRVDLDKPTFSNPTSITNPLFSRDTVSQVIQLGAEGKDKLRFEVTNLPETKFIKWNGQRVETRVTHFVAYMNGRILEVATDFYAQADDGSVWYFGENVDNYENGVIVDHEGTWLAGKDGPPGMIMPADPKVGDVYRPENIPGLVFEEVTVKRTGVTVNGPRGPVPGAVFVQERLMDGTIEDKIFAPGYGEFKARVASLDELYKLALAVPIDALGGSVPQDLSTLDKGASQIFEAAPTKRWNQLSAKVEKVIAAWTAYRTNDVPSLLDAQMTDALDVLEAAVRAHDVAEVRQAAIWVGHAALDLQLQYRGPDDVDRDRLELWRDQLVVDRAAGDSDAVTGDLATLKTIHDRINGNTQ